MPVVVHQPVCDRLTGNSVATMIICVYFFNNQFVGEPDCPLTFVANLCSASFKADQT